ncbi:MAG: hypothetical protein HY565_02975 [Candidatus Kerfeldbacteria bacterium]|nr:hypothetical protein [Candidatus Kerfeldbacteria bacterium]
MKLFGQLISGAAFTVTDTWSRDDLDLATVYVKVDEQRARPGNWHEGRWVAGTLPHVRFGQNHPVVVA